MPPRTRDIVGPIVLSVALVALIAILFVLASQST